MCVCPSLKKQLFLFITKTRNNLNQCKKKSKNKHGVMFLKFPNYPKKINLRGGGPINDGTWPKKPASCFPVDEQLFFLFFFFLLVLSAKLLGGFRTAAVAAAAAFRSFNMIIEFRNRIAAARLGESFSDLQSNIFAREKGRVRENEMESFQVSLPLGPENYLFPPTS